MKEIIHQIRNNPHYKDRLLVLYVLPLMAIAGTLIGTRHSVSGIFLDSIIIKKISYNLLTIILVWLSFRFIIHQLDQWLPWEQVKTGYRWLIQLCLTLVFTLVVLLTFTYLRTYFIPAWEFIPKLFLSTDIPLTIIFLLIGNFIYYHWYQLTLIKKPVTPTSTSPKASPLFVQKGRTTLPIEPTAIAFILRKNTINYLHTFDADRYVIDHSLRQLEEQLPASDFYRINRQLLVHRRAIHAYAVLPNRQLAIDLSPLSTEKGVLNKNRAADFKRWFAEG
ncbi:MAG: LytTR family transcriptional regulator DNA-binding domain-containing protein [Saprospiraceae bacterium]